jgi:hypothetical protein
MSKPSRKIGLAIVVIAGFLMFAGSASAQSAITANASATILQALQLSEDTPLDFGRILASTGGDVTVTQAGAQSCSGALTCFADHTVSVFTVQGTANETVDVTVDATYNLTGPGTMSATTDAPATVTIGAGGSQTFNVGGTLTVGSGQTPGVYNGTYDISVAYQ